jgi:hypothetical protein
MKGYQLQSYKVGSKYDDITGIQKISYIVAEDDVQALNAYELATGDSVAYLENIGSCAVIEPLNTKLVEMKYAKKAADIGV